MTLGKFEELFNILFEKSNRKLSSIETLLSFKKDMMRFYKINKGNNK